MRACGVNGAVLSSWRQELSSKLGEKLHFQPKLSLSRILLLILKLELELAIEPLIERIELPMERISLLFYIAL